MKVTIIEVVPPAPAFKPFKPFKLVIEVETEEQAAVLAGLYGFKGTLSTTLCRRVGECAASDVPTMAVLRSVGKGDMGTVLTRAFKPVNDRLNTPT